MSIGSIALWSSDYAYEFMGVKKTSHPHPPIDFPAKEDQNSADTNQEETKGIKPRIDEYIPTKQTEENKDKKDGQYSEEEKEQIDKLKKRDNEVRTHEQAHVAVGGAHISGGVSYTMQTAPNGQQYAIGGEVSIDTSPVKGDPEATITKMQTVRAAALAPSSPSDADRAVAAAASQTEASARAELAEKSREENAGNTEDTEKTENGETAKQTDRVQNQISAAISAYTNNYGTNFYSTINIAV